MQSFKPIISENFNGGEIFGVNPTLLKTNQMVRALNVRFRLGGGFTNRPGFFERAMTNFTGVGSDAIQGGFAEEEFSECLIAVNGKIFLVLPDFADAYEIYSGLNTTALVEFLPYNGDIYVMQGGTSPVRIARSFTSTALSAGVSTNVSTSTGQGWRFGTSGTIKVTSSLGTDDITYSGRTNDQFTITAGTVSLSPAASTSASPTYLYEVSSLSTVPKFAFGAEFQNTWFGAGNAGESTKNYQGNTLFYSVGATGLNPEKFYDFAGTGSGYIPVGDKSDIVGLVKTKTYLIILKKTSIFYCSGFDSNGIPIIQPLSDVYGCAGQRAWCVANDKVYTFTGKGIKTVGEEVGLNNDVPSVNAQFDDKIVAELKNYDLDQSDAVLHFNPDQKLMKLWATKGGAKVCFVLDTNIPNEPWSRDTGKPAAGAINYRKETFWWSDSEPTIYQDEVGYDDNGLGIRSEVRLGDFNANSDRLSKCFTYHFLNGLLGENTTVTVNIYFDDVLTQTYTLTDSLITPSGGSPIGRMLIGGGVAVSSEDATLGYFFELETLLKKRRNTSKMSVEFIADGEGQIFEIQTQQINGFYSTKFDRSIRR